MASFRVEEVSDLLMQRLGSQLKTALEAGGPESAFQVCQQAGQPLTDAADVSEMSWEPIRNFAQIQRDVRTALSE